MDNIKQYAKKIWNSRCKYLVIIACALILANGVNLLQTSLKFFNKKGEMVEEVKSVVIKSETWESKEPGSWKITKSAEWTGYKEATIRFDVDTTKKTIIEKKEEEIEGSGADIILVLDVSGSMGSNNKLVRLKEGAMELANVILAEDNHQIELIAFDSSATVKATFTNDKNIINNQINSLSSGGGTSYVNAYKEVISLLSKYEQDKNRDLIMLFLTDGEASSATAQYSILKSKYDITIIGIQYNMGKSLKNSIMSISDKQYLAEAIDINMVLFESIVSSTNKIHAAESGKLENYEMFEIEDDISKDFYVNSVEDIKVSRGTVKLEMKDDGIQKIIWTLTGNGEVPTGTNASMEIVVNFQGELNPEIIYPTNEKEEIKTKLPNEKENIVTSELTPQLRAGYYVIYDPNFPKKCNPSEKDLTMKNSYFAYEIVDRIPNNYTCSGWQFKGWQIDESIPSANDEQFILPTHDIRISGIWTKVDLEKNMDGKIYIPAEMLVVAMKENAGTVSVDSSINFSNPSSKKNGRGLYIRSGTENDTNPIYYYRGAVTNNNVLFAGICWQIVRTTETGGIKLIYNGVSNDGKTCSNHGDSFIGTSTLNSNHLSFGGYMSGFTEILATGNANLDESSRIWGNDVSYDFTTGMYTLINVRSSSGVYPTTGYRYTCDSAATTCQDIYYGLLNAPAGNIVSGVGVIKFTKGETLDTYKQKMSQNIYDSLVKTKIDNWYKMNIEDKGYTKYLEDAVWCNNRTITSGPLLSKDTTVENGATTYFGNVSTRVKDKDICPNVNDRFTVSTSTGNGALTYPVGMITADEVLLSGILKSNSYSDNEDSYLIIPNIGYWTMTPAYFSYSSVAGSGSVYSYTNFAVGSYSIGSSLRGFNGLYHIHYYKNLDIKIRPVISLSSDILVYLEGNGTASNPYVVVQN